MAGTVTLHFSGSAEQARKLGQPEHSLKVTLPSKWTAPVDQGGKTMERLMQTFTKSYNAKHAAAPLSAE